MKELANPQAAGLQVFYNESENVSIRTEVIDGEPWFVAKDVCMLLDLSNPRDILAKVLDDDEKGVDTIYTPGEKQQMSIINESGLYHLIFVSRKPEAKTIRRWVTGTVLPSIRRTGGYTAISGKEEGTRLPLPRFRAYFKEWKESLTPLLPPQGAGACGGNGGSDADTRDEGVGGHIRQPQSGIGNHHHGEAEPQGRNNIPEREAGVRATDDTVGQ